MIQETDSKKDLECLLFAKIKLANLLWVVGEFDKCLSYLQEVEKSMEEIDDPFLKSELYQEYAQYYFQLNLFELAKSNNEKALKYLYSESDLNNRNSRLAYL
ncbi:hypothetical protein ACFSKL_21280 [Belliella marina]|uniref:Tetratricopeptide repeat-containing protein n=1 Tax=Belliella marina TaxID=1644146 RepID=A0ABW4VRI2_9BACT